MDCPNCRILAPGLCTYHIMDLSGCDMAGVEEGAVPDGDFWDYLCPHCGNTVLSTKFCDACYIYSNPAALMLRIRDVPRWRCEDCGAPKIVDTTQDMNIGPCGRCLRRGFTFVTSLTPEQLAAWVKGGALWLTWRSASDAI